MDKKTSSKILIKITIFFSVKNLKIMKTKNYLYFMYSENFVQFVFSQEISIYSRNCAFFGEICFFWTDFLDFLILIFDKKWKFKLQNRSLGKKFLVKNRNLVEILTYDIFSNFWFLTKFRIFLRCFLLEILIFEYWPTFEFLTKFSIFDQTVNVSQNYRFFVRFCLEEISDFWQNLDFWLDFFRNFRFLGQSLEYIQCFINDVP